MTRVTILTASTGRPALARCIESVATQTHKDIQHLIFADGEEAGHRINHIVAMRDKSVPAPDVINLPYSVGKDRWNGHRIYGAGTFLADDKSEYLMFLDDDNTIDSNHVESLLAEFAKPSPPAWAYSLRKITDEAGNFLCNDDCESLGLWPSILSTKDRKDNFVDVNCYFLPRKLAVAIAPVWYRKFREPGQPEIDRVIAANLMPLRHINCTKQYTVNYAVGGSALSVQPDFFKYGNAAMLKAYNGILPWTK
jgi:glycosyltransferase involved in cell wall biosynthesis